MAVDASAAAPKSDTERLHELGNAQELGQVIGTPEEPAALEAELEAVAAGKAPVSEFIAMEDEMERRPDERT